MLVSVGHNIKYQIYLKTHAKSSPCTYKHMIYTQKTITQASGPLEIIRKDYCNSTIFRSKDKCNQNINKPKNLVKKIPSKLYFKKLALGSIYPFLTCQSSSIFLFHRFSIHMYLQLESSKIKTLI